MLSKRVCYHADGVTCAGPSTTSILKCQQSSSQQTAMTFRLRKTVQILAYPTRTNLLEELIFLNHVALENYDLKSMFSSLVNLKVLRLRKRKLPAELSVATLLHLKEFYILKCRGVDKIHLSNANLMRLDAPYCRATQFDLYGVPNLLEFCWSLCDEELHFVFTDLPKLFPKLKILTLHPTPRADWVQGLPKIMAVFNTVTQLRLIFPTHVKLYFELMIPMLKAFPFLEKFSLMTCCRMADAYYVQEPVASECALKNLKVIQIRACRALEHIEFIGSLLKYAVALKRLIYTNGYEQCRTCGNFKNDRQWVENEHLLVYERLHSISKDLSVVFNCV